MEDLEEAGVRARGRQPLASLAEKKKSQCVCVCVCLEVIITAACYQEETSDLRSSAPLLPPRLLGMKTKVQPRRVLLT